MDPLSVKSKPAGRIGNRSRAFLGRNGLHKLRPPSYACQARARPGLSRRPPLSAAARDESFGTGRAEPKATRRSVSPPRGPKAAASAAPPKPSEVASAARAPVAPLPAIGTPYRGLIGNTPLVDLSFLSARPGVKILGKAEFLNPSGSIKDRIANHIITKAEQEGKLRPGGTVVAATSGNTGSAVAMVCAMRGYKYVVITNSKTSKEKCDSMAAYGGQVLVGPSGVSADDPMHYQNLAKTLCSENPDYFDVDQYDNPRNPEAYYLSLGPEIWEQTEGCVTHFVAGGSTGGTISGTGRFLKEKNREIQVCMPDPCGSVFWDYWQEGIPESKLKPKSYQVQRLTR